MLKEARLSQPSALHRRVLTRSMSLSLCWPQYAPCGSPGMLYLASVPQPALQHAGICAMQGILMLNDPCNRECQPQECIHCVHLPILQSIL